MSAIDSLVAGRGPRTGIDLLHLGTRSGLEQLVASLIDGGDGLIEQAQQGGLTRRDIRLGDHGLEVALCHELRIAPLGAGRHRAVGRPR